MTVRILSILLVAQLALVAALYWPKDAPTGGGGSLVDSLDIADVERIEIAAPEGAAITLQRGSNGWSLESGLPADSEKVQRLLETLLNDDPGFAIARSESAAERFEVAGESFERRINLFAENVEASVFLGSSPAFRKIHARRDGSSDVFVIEFNSFDAPANASGWLDTGLLALSNIEHLAIAELQLSLEDGNWIAESGAEPDPQAMEALLMALSSLEVSGLYTADAGDSGSEDSAGADLEKLQVSARDAQGDLTLTVLQNEESEQYILRSSRYPQLFSTSAFDAERLIDAVEALRDPATETSAEDDDAMAPDIQDSAPESPAPGS